METKLILKNFWFLIIGIPVGFYYFFHYNSYNSLVSAIIITLFIIALKLIKNYKQLKIAIGIFLSTLAVWQISNQIIEGSFNLYKLIIFKLILQVSRNSRSLGNTHEVL